MSDADAEEVVEAAEEADPDDAEHEAADDTEQPDADDLPTPDLSDAPDPEEVEADVGADADDGEEEKSDGDDTSTPDVEGDTIGDLYCKMLVRATNAIIEEHGDPDAEPVEVESARQLDIDRHMDRLMDKHGMGRDLPPEQAVFLSSAMFVGSNVIAKTDAASQLAAGMEL